MWLNPDLSSSPKTLQGVYLRFCSGDTRRLLGRPRINHTVTFFTTPESPFEASPPGDSASETHMSASLQLIWQRALHRPRSTSKVMKLCVSEFG